MRHTLRTTPALLLAALAACGTGSSPGGGACSPGAPVACTCADGRPGTGVCGEDACDCPPTYALVAEPGSLDFGEVPPGAAREATLLVHNPAPRGVAIRSTQLFGEASGYRLGGETLDAIPAGGTVSLAIRFAAGTPGTPAARLRIEPDDAVVAPVEVTLTARVPGPLLACSPSALDFANTWLGETPTAAVVCVNAGLAGAGDDARLSLGSLEVQGPAYAAAWRGTPPADLAVGESAAIEVRFAPAAAGDHWGALAIRSDTGLLEIPLAGRAAALPACEVEVLPEGLHFEAVDRGAVADVEFAIRNRRADAPCLVHDLRLCDGTDPAFAIVGGPYDDALVPEGSELRVAIRFTPVDESCAGEIDGCVEFDLSPDGHRSLPLSCERPGEPSVVVSPAYLDFGAVQPGCATRDREVVLVNTGSTSVELGELRLDEPTTGEFFLRSFPPEGTSIAPGSTAYLILTYRPDDEGEDAGTLLIGLAGRDEPLRVALAGRSGSLPTQRDSFQQNDRWRLDVLFVIDNGSTMAAEASRLVPELGDLPAWLAASRVDFRLAVTTTGLVAAGPGCPGGANGGEDGRFFPVDGSRPRILDPTTPGLQAAWEANLAVGACHDAPPQTLEAAYRALAPPLVTDADDARHPEANDGNLGFLRHDAALWVVAISDRADASPRTEQFYTSALWGLKQYREWAPSFIAITGARAAGCTATDGRAAAAGDRLIDVADRSLRGDFASICGADWRSVFPPVIGPRTCFLLGNRPEDRDGNGVVSDAEGELRVLLDGVEVPSTVDGHPIWSYSPDEVAVCFAPEHLPAPNARIDVDYFVACLPW